MSERVILAYSGGLDTSVAISWIGKETGSEVVAVAIDLGQGGEDMEVVRQRALDCGAVEAVVVDARDEFADEYCLPAIQSNALYMDRYPLVSALSRPLIVKHLVSAARQYGGGVVAHGCTGKGNDQVRFEVGFGSLAPDLEVLAPVRDYAWTREKAIAFAEENSIPINVSKRSPFSIDQNVWGRAVETGFLEHLWNAPTKDVYDYTEDPTVNWSSPDEVIVGYERGVPVSIDGRPVTVLQAIEELNRRAGEQGVGVGVGERGQGLDAAGRHHHAGRPERAAGERGADVPIVVNAGGQRLDVPHGVFRLVDEGALGRAADDQVRLQPRHFPQYLQQPDPVDRAACPRDADDQSLGRTARGDGPRETAGRHAVRTPVGEKIARLLVPSTAIEPSASASTVRASPTTRAASASGSARSPSVRMSSPERFR